MFVQNLSGSARLVVSSFLHGCTQSNQLNPINLIQPAQSNQPKFWEWHPQKGEKSKIENLDFDNHIVYIGVVGPAESKSG